MQTPSKKKKESKKSNEKSIKQEVKEEEELVEEKICTNPASTLIPYDEPVESSCIYSLSTSEVAFYCQCCIYRGHNRMCINMAEVIGVKCLDETIDDKTMTMNRFGIDQKQSEWIPSGCSVPWSI